MPRAPPPFAGRSAAEAEDPAAAPQPLPHLDFAAMAALTAAVAGAESPSNLRTGAPPDFVPVANAVPLYEYYEPGRGPPPPPPQQQSHSRHGFNAAGGVPPEFLWDGATAPSSPPPQSGGANFATEEERRQQRWRFHQEAHERLILSGGGNPPSGASPASPPSNLSPEEWQQLQHQGATMATANFQQAAAYQAHPPPPPRAAPVPMATQEELLLLQQQQHQLHQYQSSFHHGQPSTPAPIAGWPQRGQLYDQQRNMEILRQLQENPDLLRQVGMLAAASRQGEQQPSPRSLTTPSIQAPTAVNRGPAAAALPPFHRGQLQAPSPFNGPPPQQQQQARPQDANPATDTPEPQQQQRGLGGADAPPDAAAAAALEEQARLLRQFQQPLPPPPQQVVAQAFPQQPSQSDHVAGDHGDAASTVQEQQVLLQRYQQQRLLQQYQESQELQAARQASLHHSREQRRENEACVAAEDDEDDFSYDDDGSEDDESCDDENEPTALPPAPCDRPGVTWSSMTSCVPVAASAVLMSLRRGTLLPRRELVDQVVESLLEERYEDYRSDCDDWDDSDDDGEEGDEENVEGGVCAAAAGAAKAADGAGDESLDVSGRSGANSEPLRPDCVELSDDDDDDCESDLSDGDHHPDDLFDPTQFNSVLTGMGGSGKTVAAAMVVSRADVLGRFCDGIAWIKLGQRRLAPNLDGDSIALESEAQLPLYREYFSHLRSLCKQLDLTPPEFATPAFLPSDNLLTKTSHILRLMEDARQDVINNLYEMTCLIVIDDAWHPDDLRWFTFLNTPVSNLRMLVTTRMGGRAATGSCAPRKYVLDAGELKECEAVQLLLSEAEIGSPSKSSRSSAGESGSDSEDEDTAAEVLYAKTMAESCCRVPLAVRSAGRLLANNASSCPSSGAASTEVLEKHQDCAALFESLERSFSQELHGAAVTRSSRSAATLGDTLKLCFVTFAAVFARPDCARPRLPLAAAQLLWEVLLTDEERASLRPPMEETAWSKAMKTLVTLGLVRLERGSNRKDKKKGKGRKCAPQVRARTAYYRVQHDCMVKYAELCLERDVDPLLTTENLDLRLVDQGDNIAAPPTKNISKQGKSGKKKAGVFKLVRSLSLKVSASRWRSSATQQEQPEEEESSSPSAVSRLDTFLIHKYLFKLENMTLESCGPSSNQRAAGALSGDQQDEYLFRHLPDHMLKVGSHVMLAGAVDMLRNPVFVRGRMAVMGVRRGAEAHASNVKTILRLSNSSITLGFGSGTSTSDDVATSVCAAVRSYLRERRHEDAAGSSEEVGRAYSRLGEALLLPELLLSERRGRVHLCRRILIDAADLFADALDAYRSAGLGDESPAVVRALRRAESLALPSVVLVPCDSDDAVVLEHASTLRGSPKREGNVSLELKSHPGLALISVPEDQVGLSSTAGGCSLAIGPREAALRATASSDTQGALVFSGGDECLVSLSSSATICNIGDRVGLSAAGHRISFEFVVTPEGRVSPASRPELALGFGRSPLLLVPRESPHRISLARAGELRKGKGKSSGSTPLVLSSHEGRGIVASAPSDASRAEIGPVGDALRVYYDGRFTYATKGGSTLKLTHSSSAVGAVVTLTAGGKGKKKSKVLGAKGGRDSGGSDFIVNDDGSVSPGGAPHLALGCTASLSTTTLERAGKSASSRR